MGFCCCWGKIFENFSWKQYESHQKKNHTYYITKWVPGVSEKKSNKATHSESTEPKRLGFNLMSLMNGPTCQSPFSESLNLSAEISKCLFWRSQFLFDLRMSSFYEVFYSYHWIYCLTSIFIIESKALGLWFIQTTLDNSA